MIMTKTIPRPQDLVQYNQAVAGHDGTLCDESGELFIKPCTAAEIAFYESSIASHPEFVEYMPTYLGTLTLDEQCNGATIVEAGAALLAQHNGISLEEASATLARNGTAVVAKHTLPEVVPVKTGKRISTNQAVVLENASYGFVRPNIMDVKLGVRLWADDAPEEKKIRFNKITAETTHKDLGFRIAGMRVWQGHNAKGVDVDEEGYRVYDKNYGRFLLNKNNVHEAFSDFIFTESAGIDEELGKLVSQAFYTDVCRIAEALANQESRMYSASLLFVFEGDGVALRAAMEEASRSPYTLVNGNESSEEDDDEPVGPKIYEVKVIDFAHATWELGNGPDENSLIGVRSVARILKKLGN